jgi:hypothetical protein
VPAADVSAQLQELRKANDSLSARLSFNVPAHLDEQERSRRLNDLLRAVMDGDAGKDGE